MVVDIPPWGNVWLKVLLDPGERPPRHFHACPQCYDHWVCTDARCTLEPDLDLDDGSPCGSHCVCENCIERDNLTMLELGA